MAKVTNSISLSGSGGSSIIVVANYSALPDPTTVSGEFYWVSNSQGTKWLPGSLGGTYYNSGLYYSNGTTWEFMNVPYQATQLEVDTGTNTDKFVTPSTLSNSTWAFTTAKTLATLLTGISFATGGAIVSTDTVLIAFGKIQKQINDLSTVYATISNLALKQDFATATTGAVISFAVPQVYNSVASPTSSNITNDLTGARIGVVQKIFHNSGSAPTFPAGWVRLGTGSYVNSTLNIIYCEWVSGSRVEYWITQ
jgi:hypothetical protein